MNEDFAKKMNLQRQNTDLPLQCLCPLITVMVRFVWTFNLHADVVCLFLR
jgi:hypothetical protein